MTSTRFLLVSLILFSFTVAFAAPTRFAVFGDYGYTALPYEQQVADMINSWHVDFIVTTGDNSYGSASIDDNIGKCYSGYIGNYTGAYGPGAPTNRFFPSIGNHDYTDGGGINAYLNYFTLPGAGVSTTGSSGNERYYDFTVGPVQFFVINCYASEPDGVDANSVQAHWLREQLAESPAQWQIVTFHYPPFSSGSHGSTPSMRWPFEAWGADVVLTGHDHTYERIMRDDNHDGDSIPYYVTGAGGRSLYSFGTPVPGSRVRYSDDYGSLFVDVTDTTISLRFYSIAGAPNYQLVDSLTIRKTPSCCTGGRGNIDCDPADNIDINDLTALVDHLFVNFTPLCCDGEADCDGFGGVDISDLTAFIDRLYVSFTPLAPCP